MNGGFLQRTTIADSWRWMRLDLVVRLIPLTAVPVLFSLLTRTPFRAFGLSFDHAGRDLLLSIPLGLAGFLVAAGFAEYLARRNRRWFIPQRSDLLVQCAYYLLLNAPVEEWFFRGFLQGTLNAWLGNAAVAVLLTTAVFGGYHFLDRWGWRPVLGATAAGLALGLIYLWQPSPPSLLAPVIVHAAITCGFLSAGPYLVYRWRVANRKLMTVPEAVRQ
jgi:membrane protease YdiL (CAAX protease family)